MTAENIVGKQENQLRELHQWAISNLCTLKNELKPYTDGARSRLNQFSDDVGVTDRYTGYRQNLTRGYVGDSMFTRPSTAPVHQSRTGSMQQSGYYPSTQTCERNLGALGKRVTFGSEALEASEGSHYKGFYTLKQGYNPSTRTCERDSGALGRRVTFGTVPPQKSEYKGYRTIDTLYPRSNTVFVDKPHSYSQALNDTLELNNLNRTMNTPTFGLQKSKSFVASQPISVQEQAGINTTFPGDTEYMTRFTNPPENVCTSDFTINPSSDFSLTGRPLTKTTFDPSFTEYQTRYEWPDGKKIERLPWLRK